jgi:hypothetical protein
MLEVKPLSPLEALVKETRDAFILAKADGKVEAGEVVQIAAGVAVKLQRLAGLSGAEKKSVALLALKRGVEEAAVAETVLKATGLAVTPEAVAGMEHQMLAAASAAIDVAFAAARGDLKLKKPASWRECLVACLRVSQTAAAAAVASGALKDHALLQEALKVGAQYAPVAVAALGSADASQGSPAPASEDPKKEGESAPPPKSDAEPSPATAVESAPGPNPVVTFA